MKLQCWACEHEFEGKPTDITKPCPNCDMKFVNMPLPSNVRSLAGARFRNAILVEGYVKPGQLAETHRLATTDP